jgi:hypothetical protein
VGDEVEVEGGRRLQVLDPKRLAFTPVLPADVYIVSICKRGHYSSPVSVDHIATLGPGELVDMTLSGPTQVSYNVGRTQAILPVNPTLTPPSSPAKDVLPGDFLILNQGGNSTVDVGYGPGVYPVVAVSSTALTLAAALTSGDVSTWKILRRR